jgi:hypothetical protein
LGNEIRGFVFRGSAHFRFLSDLLKRNFPAAKIIKFTTSPSLIYWVLGSLTMNERVRHVEFLRLLDSDMSKESSGCLSCMKAQSEAELLDEEELRAKYR